MKNGEHRNCLTGCQIGRQGAQAQPNAYGGLFRCDTRQSERSQQKSGLGSVCPDDIDNYRLKRDLHL
jgi:hypothetical protein